MNKKYKIEIEFNVIDKSDGKTKYFEIESENDYWATGYGSNPKIAIKMFMREILDLWHDINKLSDDELKNKPERYMEQKKLLNQTIKESE